MAFKQALAVAAIEKVAGKIINKSLCEVPGGWLALAMTEEGKRLVFASKEESQLGKMLIAERTGEENGVNVAVMQLNSNNGAAVRRFVKWAAPALAVPKVPALVLAIGLEQQMLSLQNFLLNVK